MGLLRFCWMWLLTAVVLQAADHPNIVLILADDFGYGDATCYNSRGRVATPHIDRLARQGLRFTDAHSPATVSPIHNRPRRTSSPAITVASLTLVRYNQPMTT